MIFPFLTLPVWNQQDSQDGPDSLKIEFHPLLFMYNSAQEVMGHLKRTTDTQRRDDRRRAEEENERTGRGWMRWRRNDP